MEGILSVVGETTDPNKTVREIIGKVSDPAHVRIADPLEQDSTPPEEVPICAVHRIPMVWQQGRKGYFWSCHEKNLDGAWCSYKPDLSRAPTAWPGGSMT